MSNTARPLCLVRTTRTLQNKYTLRNSGNIDSLPCQKDLIVELEKERIIKYHGNVSGLKAVAVYLEIVRCRSFWFNFDPCSQNVIFAEYGTLRFPSRVMLVYSRNVL